MAARKESVINSMLGVAIEPTYFDLEHHEINPAEIVGIVKNTGANTIRVGMFSHQGHAYYPSRTAPAAPFLSGKNLLQDFERECKKVDIRFAVYLNSKWVTDLYQEHPDWVVRFRNGPYIHEDEEAALVIYPMCPNSPFRDYFLNIVREVVTLSHPDAVYIDNFGIEPFCRCGHCRRKFGRAIPNRKSWNSSETQQYLRWLIKESRNMAKGIVSAARINDSRTPVIFNRGKFWSETGVYSPEDNFHYAHKIGDGIHTEAAVRLYGQSFEHINEQCTFGRSINVSVWTWVEYPMLPFSYVPPTESEAKIKAAKVVANGGRPMVWNMPCAPFVSRKGMPGIKDVFTLVSENKNLFDNIRFDKFAGIVFSSGSLRTYCQGDSVRLKEYQKTFSGAYELMIRTHLPYDFVLDDQVVLDNLKSYEAIILPNVVRLNEFQCGQVRKYVKSGGNLLATYATSLYSQKGGRLRDFALKDVFGAHYITELGEQSEGYSAAYGRFISDHPVNKNGLGRELFPAAGKHLAVRSVNSIATLLERCRYYCDFPQRETGYPAVIARKYGKGKVLYLPGEFFRAYHEKGFLEHKQCLRQTLEWFANGQLPIITDLPETVEVTVSSNEKGCRIIHLVNCSFDKTRPIEEIITVSGRYLKIKVAQNYRKAVDISTNEDVRFERCNGYLRLCLPVLTGYNVIVLTP